MKPRRDDIQVRFSFDILTAADLQAMITVGAVEQKRQTEDGRVLEYALTEFGRRLWASAIAGTLKDG